jgi:hypothetical protein
MVGGPVAGQQDDFRCRIQTTSQTGGASAPVNIFSCIETALQIIRVYRHPGSSLLEGDGENHEG